MKAVVYERYGPPEVLELKEVAKPVPGDDEVLIKVHAATVVMGDCEMRAFDFPAWFWLPLRLYAGLTRPKRVKILGQELAGVVAAVGRDVTGFKSGDEVFAPTEAGFGAHAEYRCLRATKPIAIKPAAMSFEEAAAVPTGGLNALHYLRKADIRPGEKVLINGACGTIGSFAVQLAKYFGAEVTAVDSADKLDVLREIGADRVIDYRAEEFAKAGAAYDVIFDVVCRKSFSRCLKSLRRGGRYLVVNPLANQMLRALWTSWTSDKKVFFAFAPYRTEDLNFLKGLIEAGALKSVIDRSFPLDRMADAHAYVESGDKKGNVAITVVQ